MGKLISLTEEDLLARARKIKLLILDVDGVLSDGKIYFSDAGDEIKSFNTLDGQGIKLLQGTGVEVAVITGRTSKIVARRAQDLGIEKLIQGREDKFNALMEMLTDDSPGPDEIAFMGDDLPDLRVITQVGLGLCVSNAHDEVVKRCHWQSHKHGGEGAVREACDFIMQSQGTYAEALKAFLCD